MQEIMDILEERDDVSIDTLVKAVKRRGILTSHRTIKLRLMRMEAEGKIRVTDNFRVRLVKI